MKATPQVHALVEAAAAVAVAAMHLQDNEQALERERAAAASRLREACERYENQMQAGRMRLVADTGGWAACRLCVRPDAAPAAPLQGFALEVARIYHSFVLKLEWQQHIRFAVFCCCCCPDLKLEAAAASAREEKRRAEAALEEAAAAGRQREAQLREEWARCV